MFNSILSTARKGGRTQPLRVLGEGSVGKVTDIGDDYVVKEFQNEMDCKSEWQKIQSLRNMVKETRFQRTLEDYTLLTTAQLRGRSIRFIRGDYTLHKLINLLSDIESSLSQEVWHFLFVKVAIASLNVIEMLAYYDFCHCDFKPENIMVKDEKQTLGVKIIDFGVMGSIVNNRCTAFTFKYTVRSFNENWFPTDAEVERIPGLIEKRKESHGFTDRVRKRVEAHGAFNPRGCHDLFAVGMILLNLVPPSMSDPMQDLYIDFAFKLMDHSSRDVSILIYEIENPNWPNQQGGSRKTVVPKGKVVDQKKKATVPKKNATVPKKNATVPKKKAVVSTVVPKGTVVVTAPNSKVTPKGSRRPRPTTKG